MVNYQEIIELLHKEVKPALGCTEPIAVSLAVAKGCEVLRDRGVEPAKVEVGVSANILKNAMGVGIPGTGMVGLKIAAALAMVCGKSEYGLEVLKELSQVSKTDSEGIVNKAKEIEEQNIISISLEPTDIKLYISVRCASADGVHTSKVIIRDNHDSIVYVESDSEVVLDEISEGTDGSQSLEVSPHHEKTTLDYHLTVEKIFEFATTVDIEEVRFVYEGAKLNYALAQEGLKLDYGLRVGRTIANSNHQEVFGNGLLRHCMALTAAASDARMAGSTLPAMSNSGSGNQGITASMPVFAAAQELNSSEEQLIRALTLSNLIAIHIKGYLGKLSALCGCVIASTGSSCGIVYLKGGSLEQVCFAIKNMIGNITGMVCDGAKVGCALKVASGVSSAVQSAMLALDNICISEKDGIIDHCVEKTVKNLGTIGSTGMQQTDKMILDIMICK